MNETIIDRIKFFINATGIAKSTFEKKSNLSNGYLNSVKSSIGSDKLEHILTAYPELNKIWLLTGEGEMLRDSQQNVGFVSENDNFTGDTSNINHPNFDTMNMLNEMMIVINRQSSQMDRLITQIEKGGERADRLVAIVEQLNQTGGNNVSPKKEAV